MKTLLEEAPLALFEPAAAFPPKEHSERTVQSGDVALAVKTWGDPARPTVVLVHGYPDNSEVWHEMAPILARDYYVIAYDVRGAGQSSAPKGMRNYTFARLTDDFIAVIDALSPSKPVHLIAHDWGSIQSWEFVTEERLRGRIAVQVDGQMKTGRDVVIGALLGADEFGFATAPLVAEGCIMMRKCHLNTCPVGVATQDPVLRKKFSGKPEHVVNYFFFVAEEVREIMAQLGIRSFNELIGRADLLDTKAGIEHWKARGLDFARIFYQPAKKEGEPCYQVDVQDHGLDRALDHQLIEKAKAALEKGERVSFIQPVRNVNRTVGAMLSGEVAKRYGHEGLPDDSIHVQMQGTAGQSFAAFLAHGVTLDLVGDGNDYVGKGLSGGSIVIRPTTTSSYKWSDNTIIGNTVLYGATSGRLFAAGQAGERFCVRYSGAHLLWATPGAWPELNEGGFADFRS